jgi:hypothetical protein
MPARLDVVPGGQVFCDGTARSDIALLKKETLGTQALKPARLKPLKYIRQHEHNHADQALQPQRD